MLNKIVWPTVERPPATVSLDVRTGGRWNAEMHLPEGDTVHWFGEYTEVDPPHRLAFIINDDPAAPPYPETGIVGTAFAEKPPPGSEDST